MNERRRIAVVSRLYPLPHKPHAAPFNRQQFAHLASRYDVSLLVPVPMHEWLAHRSELQPSKRDGIAIRYAGWLFPPKVGRVLYPAFFGFSMLRELRWIERVDPACVLVGWAYPDAVGWMALTRLFRLRVPVLIMAYGSDVNVHAAHATHAAQLRWAAARCAGMIFVSEGLRRRAIELGVPAHKTFVVYRGVDTERFAPIPKLEACGQINVSPQRRRVLFVGNVQRSKGTRELLKAFTTVAREYDDVDLVLVGDGDDAAVLRVQAESVGLAARVQFVGRKPHAELRPWFGAAELLCLPSHNEGLPNVVLEAMAAGIPVVATDVGGIPEAVTNDTGVLVPARDAGALARALREALARTWDSSAITARAARFSWAQNLDSMSSLIDRACEAARADGTN